MNTTDTQAIMELTKHWKKAPTVSARDIYKGLGISSTHRFSRWWENNSKFFEEHKDWTSVVLSTEVQNNGGVQVRELDDYQVTLDMAKHLCLMSKTEMGKKFRDYFINVEKDYTQLLLEQRQDRDNWAELSEAWSDAGHTHMSNIHNLVWAKTFGISSTEARKQSIHLRKDLNPTQTKYLSENRRTVCTLIEIGWDYKQIKEDWNPKLVTALTYTEED
jgi:phage anti-repressor protein